MLPVLFKLGRFEIHAYGLLLAISFLLGIYWAMSRADRRGVDRNMVMDLSLIVVLCAIFGSRLLYVVTHLFEFKGRWLDTINPFQSTGQIGIAGLSMLGGVVLSVIAILIFCHVKKLSLLKLGDILSPAFGLGIFLTRIGCFLNGCCFGQECGLPWAVKFPLTSPAGSIFQGIAIHPTQLYASLYGLLITVILFSLDKKERFDGFIMSVFFILYGVSRFLVEFIRYAEPSTMAPGGIALTLNQVISLVMVVSGMVLFIILQRRSSSTPEST
ncbi:prolipoprotein diacylglyceryl transferase [bacterium]|nr:prolipoprotein diacylglyceryl transferase [bacterium]